MLGVEFPIFAFSHCRDVVAAVSRAGGMGVLGALYFTPEELEMELKWIDDHVDGRPYGVDVVMPASYAGADLGVDSPEDLVGRLQGMIPDGHRAFVDDLLAAHGVAELSGSDAGRSCSAGPMPPPGPRSRWRCGTRSPCWPTPSARRPPTSSSWPTPRA